MDIFMIWASDPFDGGVWLVDAWDNDSISSNQEGWVDCLKKHRQRHGVDNVRVVISSVDLDGVRASFMVPRVKMA